MPASKETPNFKLPVYGPLDKASYLVTFNGLTQKLDEILLKLQQGGSLNEGEIEAVKMQIETLQEDVTQNAAGVADWTDWKNEYQNRIKKFSPIRQVFNTTPAAGCNISWPIYYTFGDDIMIQFTLACTVANATSTTADGIVSIDIFSFPQTIPFIGPENNSIEKAKQIGQYWATLVESDGSSHSALVTCAAYRNENVTRVYMNLLNEDYNKTTHVNIGGAWFQAYY